MKEVSVCFGEAVTLVISFPAEQFLNRTSFILGLQPRDKAAMLVVNAIIFFRALHVNGVSFSEERNAFVLVLQFTNMAAMTSRAIKQQK